VSLSFTTQSAGSASFAACTGFGATCAQAGKANAIAMADSADRNDAIFENSFKGRASLP